MKSFPISDFLCNLNAPMVFVFKIVLKVGT